MRILGILLPAATVACLFAQNANRPLTNHDIEAMIAGGVPESTIEITIRAAAMDGMVDLDASPAAITELKQKGASEQVLNEVAMAAPLGAELKRRQEEDRAVPGLPDASGVYYKEPSGFIALKSFLLWPPFYSGSFYGHARTYSVPVSGGRSELQVAGGQQTFYLREPSSGAEWQIVRVTPHENERLLRMRWTGDFFGTDQFRQEEVRNVQMTKLAGDVYALSPAAPLSPGEYVLCSAAPGGPELKVCYGFGVR